MSIKELLNPEEETPVFQDIPTAEEVFAQVNTPQEEAEPELKLKPVPTDAETLAALSIVIDHMEGTGTAKGLNLDSPLQKYIDTRPYAGTPALNIQKYLMSRCHEFELPCNLCLK
jgi:hypothetical protein